MCSYWRARLVPFLTPAGGMGRPPSEDAICTVLMPAVGAAETGCASSPEAR